MCKRYTPCALHRSPSRSVRYRSPNHRMCALPCRKSPLCVRTSMYANGRYHRLTTRPNKYVREVSAESMVLPLRIPCKYRPGKCALPCRTPPSHDRRSMRASDRYRHSTSLLQIYEYAEVSKVSMSLFFRRRCNRGVPARILLLSERNRSRILRRCALPSPKPRLHAHKSMNANDRYRPPSTRWRMYAYAEVSVFLRSPALRT